MLTGKPRPPREAPWSNRGTAVPRLSAVPPISGTCAPRVRFAGRHAAKGIRGFRHREPAQVPGVQCGQPVVRPYELLPLLVFSFVSQLPLGFPIARQAPEETHKRPVCRGARSLLPSVSFPEHLRGHLEVVERMASRQVRSPAQQLKNGEVGASLNEKQSLVLRHAASPALRSSAKELAVPRGGCPVILSLQYRANTGVPVSRPYSRRGTIPAAGVSGPA